MIAHLEALTDRDRQNEIAIEQVDMIDVAELKSFVGGKAAGARSLQDQYPAYGGANQ
ncbi:MAG TPA: hypothetical protein VHQ90_08685 [Thermoanaerobaculia bacterium]|nr:hypothetical protein [Thermoanaerobaculia bacterium]